MRYKSDYTIPEGDILVYLHNKYKCKIFVPQIHHRPDIL